MVLSGKSRQAGVCPAVLGGLTETPPWFRSVFSQCCPHLEGVSSTEQSDQMQFSFLSSGVAKPFLPACHPLLSLPSVSPSLCGWAGATS